MTAHFQPMPRTRIRGHICPPLYAFWVQRSTCLSTEPTLPSPFCPPPPSSMQMRATKCSYPYRLHTGGGDVMCSRKYTHICTHYLPIFSKFNQNVSTARSAIISRKWALVTRIMLMKGRTQKIAAVSANKFWGPLHNLKWGKKAINRRQTHCTDRGHNCTLAVSTGIAATRTTGVITCRLGGEFEPLFLDACQRGGYHETRKNYTTYKYTIQLFMCKISSGSIPLYYICQTHAQPLRLRAKAPNNQRT